MKAPQVFLAFVAVVAIAGTLSVMRSRGQAGELLHTRSQFGHLQAGDRIVYLCRQCDSRREATIASPADASERFKEGATINCPGCKDVMKVVFDRPSGDASGDTEVRFVNEKGKECLRIARALPHPK